VGKLDRSLGDAAPKGLSPGPLGASMESSCSLKEPWSRSGEEGASSSRMAPYISVSGDGMLLPSPFLWEPREPVGEGPADGTWRGRGSSSSSEGVPGAPLRAVAPRIVSWETSMRGGYKLFQIHLKLVAINWARPNVFVCDLTILAYRCDIHFKVHLTTHMIGGQTTA